MNLNHFRWYLPVMVAVLPLSLLFLSSCSTTSSSSSSSSEFYNAGNASISVTGAQFDQFELYAFDTSSSALTLALPSAADIIDNLSSPIVGEVFFFAVSAEGAYSVTLTPGTNLNLNASAKTVPPNTTVTMYCELDNVTSGNEEATIF